MVGMTENNEQNNERDNKKVDPEKVLKVVKAAVDVVCKVLELWDRLG